jgi:hypothetical protein
LLHEKDGIHNLVIEYSQLGRAEGEKQKKTQKSGAATGAPPIKRIGKKEKE